MSLLTKESLVVGLFEFIKKYFDHIECKGSAYGWWKKRWSPYITAFFIIEGTKLLKEKEITRIGHSDTQGPVFEFMKKLKSEAIIDYDYTPDNKYPNRLFDISWHKPCRLFLALEHEEDTTNTVEGETDVARNVNHIREEIDKMSDFSADFNFIITRPQLRGDLKRDTYSDATEYYKKEIESKLSTIINYSGEWIVILIMPVDKLKPKKESNVRFYAYTFQEKHLSLFFEDAFTVTMDDKNIVTTVKAR
jgi:hypothetical protein